MQQKTDADVTSYELFGLLNASLVKVMYQYDAVENKMSYSTLEKNLTDIQLDGTLVRAVVSRTDFVISCADCTNSSV